MSAKRNILICQCAGRGLLDKVDEAADSIMNEQPVVIPDLCKAASDKASVLSEIAASEQPVIYACHPRAIRALFAHAGHPLPENTEFVDLRPSTPRPFTSSSHLSDSTWFPVIDYDRCTNCGQCHDFCLFGVYEKDDEGRVVVANPDNCKNNCPACARICSETAIIFPKVREAPINGGEIPDEAERRANIKINVEEILGDDVYTALNARKQRRRSLLDRKKIEKALEERRNCLETET